MEFKDSSRIEEVGRDMIVEAAPIASDRAADATSRSMPRGTTEQQQAGPFGLGLKNLALAASRRLVKV